MSVDVFLRVIAPDFVRKHFATERIKRVDVAFEELEVSVCTTSLVQRN